MATIAKPLTDVQDANRRRAIGQNQSFTGAAKASGFQGGQIDETTKNLRSGLETDVAVGTTVTPVAAAPAAPSYSAPSYSPPPRWEQPEPVYTAPKPTTPLATVEPTPAPAPAPVAYSPPPLQAAPAPAPAAAPADTKFNDSRHGATIEVTAPTMTSAADQWAMNQYQAASAWQQFYQNVAKQNVANGYGPQRNLGMNGQMSTK